MENTPIIYKHSTIKIKGNIFTHFLHFDYQTAIYIYIYINPFQKQPIHYDILHIYYIVTFYKIQNLYFKQRL